MIRTQLLFRKLTFSIIVSLFSLTAFSQQSDYSLLWRISGNGLSKPSYLFGTMHVKDKRVFNFSDSVMLALQSCSRFALEVHPDTVISKMFAILQNNDSLRTIDKLLDSNQYKKLAKKFKEKNGYTMGKTDPILLESLMEPDEDKPDDKVSFIDVYLYGIARTMNKNIFGLEDASAQFDEYFGSGDAIKERLLDLLDDDIAASKDEGREEMVKIYSTGNLDAIYKYAQESGMLDTVITARNKVMASSMIKYMTNESLFTAVGAAHLPGPDGVIALLRKAGYQVDKVKASFTGIAATYHIDFLKMNWPEYRDDNKGYSINFPGTPIKNELNGARNIIYPDMANDIYYGLYAIPKGSADEPANRETVIANTIDFLSKNKNNSILSKKTFLYNKVPCTELLIKTNTGYMRLRLVLANNLLYYYYVGSKHNHLDQPYASKFFNSFNYFLIPQKPAAPWLDYSNANGAFAVKFPEEPKVMSKEIPSKIQDEQVSFTINMYLSTDSLTGKTYLVRYNDYPAGTFLSNKDVLFSSLIDEFKGKGKILAGPVKIWMSGYEGREVKALLTGNVNAIIRLYVRGNRVYMLIKAVAGDLKSDDPKDIFFSSFHFSPYAEPQYYTYQPEGQNFKVQMVSKPKVKPDSSKSYESYLNHTIVCFSTNPASGGLFDLEYSKISPYYRIGHVDSLYKKMTDLLADYRDSLIKVDTITVGGIQGRELLTIRKETNVKKRARILIDGDNFFYLSAHVDSTELFDKTSATFFNSLTLTHPSQKTDLASSKAEKICRDLQSSDTLVYKSALGAISYYKFTTGELHYIYAALNKSYTDDTSKLGARYTLIKKLKTVNNDSTITVLAGLYPSLSGDDALKAGILNTMPFINKKTGYDIYMKLFITDPPVKVKEAAEIFTPLEDSVEFAAVNFEKYAPFIKYDNYRSNILRIAKNIANEKNDTCFKVINDNYLKIMAYAQADIDNYIAIKDSTDNAYSSSTYSYMQLMSKMKFTELNDKLTKRYLEKDPNGLYASDAIVARINNHLPNNQLLVNKYLDSIGTRYDLMEAYNNQQQLAKVPLKYRKQDEYAKLCLYQYISSDDYGSPTKITLLGSILKNGSVYWVFKYLLPDKEETKHLIGICGPYKAGATRLNFKKYYAYTGYDILKTNWRLQGTKLIKPLIDAYKVEK